MARCPKCNLYTCNPYTTDKKTFSCKFCGFFPSYPIKDKLGRELYRVPFIPKNK